MKTSELTGAQLDYWVAKALSTIDAVYASKYGHPVIVEGFCLVGHGCYDGTEFARRWGHAPEWEKTRLRFAPSSCWEEGGPIIEREGLAVMRGSSYTENWEAGPSIDLQASGAAASFCGGGSSGPTPLIAAMRAYVLEKFGDEVEDA